jgi:uncharacterized protein
MLIYLDSAILIYYFDGIGPFQIRATNRLTALQVAGDQVAVSDLTRLECRVKPIQLGDALRLSKFDGFFALPDVRIVPLTTTVYDRATAIRAAHAIKTLDAIHLAAAVEGGCAVFLTNDTRLGSFHDLTVEVLPYTHRRRALHPNSNPYTNPSLRGTRLEYNPARHGPFTSGSKVRAILCAVLPN